MSRAPLGPEAISLLRRIDAGDEKAYAEVADFLKRVDEENDEIRKRLDAEDRAREKRERDREAARKRSRIGSGKFEIAPSHEKGCDYGAEGIVLLRNKTHRLVWRNGSKYWSGIGSSSYAPADLSIMLPSGHGTQTVELTENHMKALRGKDYSATRRLSAKVVLMFRKQIDVVFGEGAAERASKLEGTVVL